MGGKDKPLALQDLRLAFSAPIAAVRSRNVLETAS